MTYNEWLTTGTNANLFNDFPQLKKFLENRYFNYELKYSDQSFGRQLLSLIVEYSPTLIAIEKAFVLRANADYSLENLGDKTKVSGTDNTTITGVDSKNYLGYEVSGEFEKNNENRTDNKVIDQTTTTYNFLDVLNSLESKSHILAWNSFEYHFRKLFILIYNLEL